MTPLQMTYKIARRIVITALGSTVLLLGIAMLVMPGPALVFIPIGLAILGLEFAWARSWLKRVRLTISNNAAEHRGQRAERHRRRHTG